MQMSARTLFAVAIAVAIPQAPALAWELNGPFSSERALSRPNNADSASSKSVSVVRTQIDLEDFSRDNHEQLEPFFAPGQTFGAFADFKIIPNLTFGGQLDYFSWKVGDYQGHLINAQVGFRYQLLKYVGVGAGYRYVDYRLAVADKRYDARFLYDFSGPAIFLEARF
jgi:hypothetical protein